MSLLKKLFVKKQNSNEDNSDKLWGNDNFFELSSSLEENKKSLQKLFDRCADFFYREFMMSHHRKAIVFYFVSLASSDQINKFVLEQLMKLESERNRSIFNVESITNQFLPVHSVKTSKKMKDVLLSLYEGDCVILIENVPEALIVGVREPKGRSASEPLIEVSAIGPQEGFVEDIKFNAALLRKRVKTAKMKLEHIDIGRITKNRVGIFYIEDLAKNTLVEELKQRLNRIDTDGFIDSGHLRRFINDSKYSAFPMEIMTERPDRCVNHLMEGRIVLLIDGSPFALIYPSVFIDLIRTSDEAYMQYYMAILARVIRFISLLLSIFGGPLYIALTVFHPGMIPTQLLITISSSRAGIPFPAIMEAVIMEFLFEILREANIRIPKPIGPSISIVGGLVIGQSVVEAGIASQAMIIVVALTSISSFAVPGYTTNSALRWIRFPFMMAASFFGMFGIISLFIVILIHIASLRSLGVPYLSPLAPLNLKDIRNILLHNPYTQQISRPSFLETENEIHTSEKSHPEVPQKTGGTR